MAIDEHRLIAEQLITLAGADDDGLEKGTGVVSDAFTPELLAALAHMALALHASGVAIADAIDALRETVAEAGGRV